MPEYAAFCRNCGASMSIEQEPDSEKKNSPLTSEAITKIEKSKKSNLNNEVQSQPFELNSASKKRPVSQDDAVNQAKGSGNLSKQKINTAPNQKHDTPFKKMIKK